MALLFMDGMSHYQTSDILRKWTSQSNDHCTWEIDPTGGRNGGAIKRVSTSNQSPGPINKAPTVTQAGPWTLQSGGVCGFALKVDDLSKVSPSTVFNGITVFYNCIFSVWNGSNTMLVVDLSPDGTLSLVSGIGVNNGNSMIARSINAVSSGLWSFLEFKWIINSGTTGTFIARSKGVVVMSYTGRLFPDTYPWPPPLPLWSSVDFLGKSSVPDPAPLLTMRMCDVYLCDLTGARNNDFLGDVAITRIKPNGGGSASGWAPVPVVANFNNVNEIPPTDDANYNTATSPGTIDLYNFEDIPVNMNPVAAQHCILNRQTIPGTATIKSAVKSGATTVESPAQEVANTVYGYNIFPYDNNPITSAQWTRAEVNAAEFGIDKVT